MTKKELQNKNDDELITINFEEDELDENNDNSEEESTFNIPLNGSPLYPRIYIGDSAKPLSGQFSESEYIDDNVSRTWTGLLTSFYG